MRNGVLIGWVVGLSACAGARPVLQQGEVPPPRLTQQQVELEREAEASQPIDPDAARDFLDSELERQSQLPPARPPVEEPLPRTVERIVYVPNDDPYYSDYYYRHGYRQDRRRYSYSSSFPAYTLTGATLGAIIGHNSRHGRRRAGQGALIGAGAGLLIDVLGRE